MPDTLFLVGEFSRLTHLTAKTLRHYHDVDLLVPAVIDPFTGYRYYTPDQIPQAQLIRRLRNVRMPVPQIRQVLAAPDENARDAVIAQHLEQLQLELVQTAAAVGSLRSMLSRDPQHLELTYHPGQPQRVLAVSGQVSGSAELGPWFEEVFPRLFVAARRLHAQPCGAGAALYPGDWFSGEEKSVTAFLPIDPAATEAAPEAAPEQAGVDGVQTRVLDPQPYAVATHHGRYSELDRTYGALGEHVETTGIAAPGPIRENYLIGPTDTSNPEALRTEVCWPITRIPN